MKVAIVLLGLVAVSMAAVNPRSITSIVEDMASDFIDGAKSDLTKLEDDLKSLTASVTSKADSYVSSATAEINSAMTKVQDIYSGLVAKGGAVKSCAVTQFSQFAVIKDTAFRTLGGCTTSLTNSLKYAEEDVSDLIGEMKDAISQVLGFVKTCVSQVLEAITCAISHINPAKELIDGVVADVEDAMATAKTRAQKSLVTIEGCALQTVSTAASQFSSLGQNLKSCL